MAWLSVTDQLALIAAGELHGSEARDEGIRRCVELDSGLGFLASPLFERAPAGVPMLLKDAGQEVAGTSHWAGLAALRDVDHRSSVTTPLAARLERAGLSIIGKSACPPLANGVTTEPPGFAPTRNPWDLTRSVGGSSGGAAAAVASGAVAVAHGSDATGSLRFPAALCGVATLVPTAGAVAGIPPCGQPANDAWRDFVLARDARDLALLFEVLVRPLRPDAVATPQRVGLLDHDPELGLPVDPACVAAVRALGELLASMGCDVEPGWPPALDTLWERAGSALAVVADATRPSVLRWVAQRLDRPVRASDVPDEVFAAASRDRSRSVEERRQAQATIDDAISPIATWWQDHDLLVTPATFENGWQLGSDPGLRQCGTLAAPFSLTGQPSIVVPVPAATGPPIGVQIVGRRGDDDRLIRLAERLQDALDSLSYRPPAFAN